MPSYQYDDGDESGIADNEMGNFKNLSDFWTQNMVLNKQQTGTDEPDDETLIMLANNGDRLAFANLIERHYDLIFKIAYQWCANQNDAEDITQEVCLKLAKVLKKFDGRAKFTSWLYRIVLNCTRDMQRSRMRQNKRHIALKDITQGNSPANQEDAASLSQMWQAVRQLPDKQCDAVLLVYAQELNHKEAAQIMNVKESTVSGYVMQARKQLKGLL